jgi:hypothetical protein
METTQLYRDIKHEQQQATNESTFYTADLVISFYILLTLHPNIMIVIFYQLVVQIIYFNTFIIFLYMFRALLCLSSGGQIVLVHHLVSSLWKQLTCFQSDDTRCCTNTICPPEGEHNSARNM